MIYAESLADKGFKAHDALHIACAVFSDCEYFLTTDKRVLKKQNAVTQSWIQEDNNE